MICTKQWRSVGLCHNSRTLFIYSINGQIIEEVDMNFEKDACQYRSPAYTTQVCTITRLSQRYQGIDVVTDELGAIGNNRLLLTCK